MNFIEVVRPTIIIQMGDLYDFFSWGRFPRPFEILPKDEAELGRKIAIALWKQIRLIAPKAELWQILGNHDDRAKKRIVETMPEIEPFVNLEPMWQFDGVHTVPDSKRELELAGIIFQHGHRKFGEHVKYNLAPTVTGHTHTGGVSFITIRDKLIWELNAGYLADPTKTPLKYNPQKWTRWTHGVGFIDNWGPRFIQL